MGQYTRADIYKCIILHVNVVEVLAAEKNVPIMVHVKGTALQHEIPVLVVTVTNLFVKTSWKMISHQEVAGTYQFSILHEATRSIQLKRICISRPRMQMLWCLLNVDF